MSIEEQIRALANRMDRQFAENEAQRRENEAQREHTDRMLGRISRNFDEFQEYGRQMSRTLGNVIEQLDRTAGRLDRNEALMEKLTRTVDHLSQTVDRFIASLGGKRSNGQEEK